MKKRNLAALLAAFALTLTACGEPVIGTVIGHQYDDADTYMSPQQHCTSDAKGMSHCSTIMVQRYDPEHYELRVRLDSNRDEIKSVTVDPHTYETVKDGDHYEESK